MKKSIIFLFLGILTYSISSAQSDCKLIVQDFKTFCGITSGQTFEDVKNLYGEPDTFEDVGEGDSYWVYYFTETNYPMTLEVHKGDQKIWTVYMEILSIDNMYNDIETAIDVLNIEKCIGKLLGQDITYAHSVMGKDYYYEDKGDFKSYIYDAEDFSIEVVLDYYVEQYSKCTRIMVYFFEQLPDED